MLKQESWDILIKVKLLQTKQLDLIWISPNIKSNRQIWTLDRFDHNYDSICVFPKKFFFKFLLLNRKMCLAHAKRCSSVKIKMGMYKIDALTYFHSCVNSIWYCCCLTLEGQYLRRICCLLSWLTILKLHWKLNLKINYHLEFVIIVCQISLVF